MRASLVLAFVLLGCAHTLASEPDWTAYEQLLQHHVKAGEINGILLNTVNYTAWRDDPRWPQVVALLDTFPAQQLQTRDEKLSFYINAYNILAIKMVLDHWPVDSIKDAGSLLWPVWRKDAGRLHGKRVSLQQVEDELIRSQGDPRIHFAIVCASVSCPDLRTEPYRAATLNTQLDDQARRFLHNPHKGLRVDGGTVHVSKIFDWFENDFDAAGGVESFIRRYRVLPEGSRVEADVVYDWGVNGGGGDAEFF